jgi:hypothetical protein
MVWTIRIKKLNPRGKDCPLSIALLEEDSTIFEPRKVVKAHHHVGCMSLISPGHLARPRKPRTPHFCTSLGEQLFLVPPVFEPWSVPPSTGEFTTAPSGAWLWTIRIVWLLSISKTDMEMGA